MPKWTQTRTRTICTENERIGKLAVPINDQLDVFACKDDTELDKLNNKPDVRHRQLQICAVNFRSVNVQRNVFDAVQNKVLNW